MKTKSTIGYEKFIKVSDVPSKEFSEDFYKFIQTLPLPSSSYTIPVYEEDDLKEKIWSDLEKTNEKFNDYESDLSLSVITKTDKSYVTCSVTEYFFDILSLGENDIDDEDMQILNLVRIGF